MISSTKETREGAPRHSLLSDQDIYLFNEGTHLQLHDKLGAHVVHEQEQSGTYFAVWAPNAESVSVIGDFNGWDKGSHALQPRGSSGVWEGRAVEARVGSHYKYHIRSRQGGATFDKADPFGFFHQTPPQTASLVWDLQYEWGDAHWMARRGERNRLDRPWAVYEVHVGSWKRRPDGLALTYRELAPELADYVKRMGYTHVELLPVMEHPFYGSWGYQVTGYFAPTSRYGTPQDFKYLVDYLHQQGIGVILDWVPSHFPNDPHGLASFDGTYLFEHADPRQGFHPDWKSMIFNFGRNEVRSFLLSSALFWLDEYHADGLRVDGVASMLYLDYSRKAGEWIPNKFGGRENLEAIDFLRQFNRVVYERHPDIQTIAEESTAWPMVSRPVFVGGLGFGMKWDMGWMHDTLAYFRQDPIHRKYHHDQLTFRSIYQFHENFMLSLSHDEVVHGKGSLLQKMPGDEWQKFANLRLLFGYMTGQPGKKLLFMGGDIGQWSEWWHEGAVDWPVLQNLRNAALQRWMRALNQAYAHEPALHELDCEAAGFEWIDARDADRSVIAFLRKARNPKDCLLLACNFTPVPRHNYRLGCPRGGYWRELLNSDALEHGGSGQGNFGGVEAHPVASHGRYWSLNLTLPPLAVLVFKPEAA